jgi:hypothetical protein
MRFNLIETPLLPVAEMVAVPTLPPLASFNWTVTLGVFFAAAGITHKARAAITVSVVFMALLAYKD